MENWIPFSHQEYDQIWDRIYRDFKFKPSTSIFPSFQVPHPFITYDISDYLRDSIDLDTYDDLEEQALDAFKEITSVDEYILALDWQHESYWVNPRLEFEKDEFGEWTIPIFPNGDYYFFIQKNFKWGYLGHPWEKSITIFGEELINAFDEHKPRMFSKILRQS
ncbi:DUF2716 domain-containing protein [Planococcus sp. NCCP-2050]|uniref:DUF2716 domain-containing protein n=1 Tax=Planococcus sp. NCCP-2050 TaxID=2944679 RepID=UPI00203C51C9|nr:DUF2716 domain-containing protein [Planococcus sp. NCCP-2050]GKW44564.1 hypothetical protein NCCP2050_02560 [Planococcus sp. NCCP-2050]